jgi:hypothetical protein
MKKGVFLLLAIGVLPAWSLDWELPVFTMRYEVTGGENEDPDDETLQPSSLRNIVSLRVKESADPAAFGLTLTAADKDCYLESGDYSYLKVDHDATLRLSKAWKIGYVIGSKWMDYADLDSEGLSKDLVSVNAGAAATLTIAPGTSIEAGLAGRFALADNPQDARQTYVPTAELSTRLGEWLLTTRYRGEFRLPFGGESATSQSSYNTGSISLQWDPNR